MGAFEPTMAEMGYGALQPPQGGTLPLNGGLWGAPHYETFISFMNTAARSYWWSFDEALNDSTCNADAMWNDATIREPLNARQRPVVGLEWQLQPQNQANKLELAFSNKLTQVIKDIPYFQQFRRCLMDAVFFGKAGVQLLMKWDYSLGYKRAVIAEWYPVHGDKVVFKWDGTPGILVNPTYTAKKLEYTERGTAHFLTPTEQLGFVYHKFEPEDASYYRPQSAASIYGSGMRGRIYWWWWLRQNLQKFMMNFVKKAGNGYLLVAYPTNNPRALEQTQTAIEGQQGNNVVYVPVNIQAGEKLDQVMQHVQIPMTGAEFQWTIITGINELIRQTFLGESGTTQSNLNGLNSDSDQHGMTADERVKYDAVDLETPLQKLTAVLNQYNCPANPCPRFAHLADKRQPKEVMEAASFMLDNGGTVPMTWAQDNLGIPNAVNNEPVLARVQPMQATAVGNTPGGTPMAGPSGPAPAPQPQTPTQMARTLGRWLADRRNARGPMST